MHEISSRLSAGPAAQVTERRAAARQRQIEIGKSRPEYQRYVEYIPKEKRSPHQPRTPDPWASVSKRQFDRQLSDWRRQLHEYDGHAARSGARGQTTLRLPQAVIEPGAGVVPDCPRHGVDTPEMRNSLPMHVSAGFGTGTNFLSIGGQPVQQHPLASRGQPVAQRQPAPRGWSLFNSVGSTYPTLPGLEATKAPRVTRSSATASATEQMVVTPVQPSQCSDVCAQSDWTSDAVWRQLPDPMQVTLSSRSKPTDADADAADWSGFCLQ